MTEPDNKGSSSNDKEKLNFTAILARSFINNRALSWLLFFAAIITGVFGYIDSPKRYNPDIDQARFVISLEVPGATAEEVEDFVVRNIEQLLSDIEDLDDLDTTSIDGGMAIIYVSFEVGVDVEKKKTEVLAKLETIKFSTQKFNVGDPVMNPVMENETITSIGFTSPTLPQNKIRELVLELRNALRQVPDIANIQIFGGQAEALRIEIDPVKMKNRNIGANNLINALNEANQKVPVGDIKNGNNKVDIEVIGPMSSPEEASRILVGPGILLSDVAEVSDSYVEENNIVEIYEENIFKPAVFLTFGQVDGSNITDVVDDTLARLDLETEKEEYRDLEYSIYRDDGARARDETNGLVVNLIESITIVFIVLLIFLQFRPALNVAIAIPITLLTTIFIGYLLGEDISKVTLFALILALGLLVDSATVVVENAYSHIQSGKPRKEAIVIAVNEIGIGLVMSTITSIIVFFPLQTVGDVMGAYIRPMGVYVPIALAASAVLALTITPFMSSVLLKAPTEQQKEKAKNKKPGLIEKTTDKYASALTWMFERKLRQYIFLASIVLALMGGFWLFNNDYVRQRSFPDIDPEEYNIYIDAPDGTDLEVTREISEYITLEAAKDPRAQSVEIFIGTNPTIDNGSAVRGGIARVNPYQASLRVKVRDPKDVPKGFKFDENIINTLRKKFDENPVIQEYLKNRTDIRIMEYPDSIPYEAPMVVKVKGPDRAVRQQVVYGLEKIMGRIEGVVHIFNSIEDPYPLFIYVVDHEKAMRSGVSAADAADALKIALGPYSFGRYRKPGLEEAAVIEITTPKNERNELRDLEQIFIKNNAGVMVPLASVTTRVETSQVQNRNRDALESVTEVSAFLTGTSIVYAMRDFIDDLENNYTFPEGGEIIKANNRGVTYRLPNKDEYWLQYGGEFEQTQDIYGDLGVAMGFAFILVYAVLVYQFKSFTLPLINMSTIPLGFIGIFPGFALLWWIAGVYMSSTAIIGFIALMGIVVNNSIMLIEYFDIMRSRGHDLKKAWVEAGRARLRPIMLTSFTTIFGTLPITLDPTWAGLAWSIVFGLAISAGFTVFLVPILYNLIQPKRS